MSVLSKVQLLTKEALAIMRSDPQHNLPPIRRHEIYQVMNDATTINPPALNFIRGKLGLLTAQYVLPIWQNISPIWTYSEEEIKKWNLSLEEVEQFKNLPDDNVLPERLIDMIKGLLEGTYSLDAVLLRIKEEHISDTVGTLVLEFFEVRNDLPLVACHACETAYSALHETLGYESLGKLPELEKYTDDDLPPHLCDSATYAVIAYAGGTRKEPVDLNKRREFWEWWLTEAIPMACSK
jgi:hypothetical protein